MCVHACMCAHALRPLHVYMRSHASAGGKRSFARISILIMLRAALVYISNSRKSADESFPCVGAIVGLRAACYRIAQLSELGKGTNQGLMKIDSNWQCAFDLRSPRHTH
eukprot:6182236-Pleurochrysis_carterae.AAC.1